MEYSWSLFIWQMLILSAIILWIYTLADLSKNPLRGSQKLLWIFIIIFFPILGSIVYLMKRKKS